VGKISTYAAADALTGTESVPVVQSGATKITTVSDITSFVTDSSSTYFIFASGNIRIGERDGNFVVDKVLGGTGFAGVEDVDWENIFTAE